MTFAIVEPRRQKSKAGRANICGEVALVYHADLVTAGISRRAVVLADSDTGRLALRAPKESEPSFAVVQNGKRGQQYRIYVKPALSKIAFPSGKCNVAHEEGMLILTPSESPREIQEPSND